MSNKFQTLTASDASPTGKNLNTNPFQSGVDTQELKLDLSGHNKRNSQVSTQKGGDSPQRNNNLKFLNSGNSIIANDGRDYMRVDLKKLARPELNNQSLKQQDGSPTINIKHLNANKDNMSTGNTNENMISLGSLG